jgi:acetyl-CoA C-acetyltransferase
MSLDPRTPVVVGTGQLRSNRGRTVEAAREPLALIRDALREAASPALLAAADAVYAVHVASWAYDGLASQVAASVGAAPRTFEDTGLGGHLPVRLLELAASRIWAGESDVALLVGGEAQASVALLGKAAVDPVDALGWSANPGGPPVFDLDQLGSPAMQAAGLIAPTRVYPLYENRLQADLGLTPEQSAGESERLYSALSAVAAAHPASWSPEALTAEQVGLVTPGNRMVCEPYPLAMNAMPMVDQAAALVVTSLEAARAHGIADEDVVFVWGGSGVDGPADVLARPDLGRVPAIGLALDRCLDAAGVTQDEVDLVDVYSCFPVVPKLVAQHLGLPRDTPLSVTGSHSSFGGPLNSYSLHALATMTSRLRGGVRSGLVHGNGGYLTSQHAILLSGAPHPGGYVGDSAVQVISVEDAVTVLTPAQAGGVCEVVVETATVEHDRSGTPSQAFVVGRTDEGVRVATATPHGDADAAGVLSFAALPPGATTHVGRRVRLDAQADGTATVAVV